MLKNQMFKKRESIEENISNIFKPISRQLSSNDTSTSKNRVYFSSKIVDAF